MRNYDLEWARKAAGLTQAEVAEALGVNVDTVGRWERGVRRMPRRQWQALVKHAGIDGRAASYDERQTASMPPTHDREGRAMPLRARRYDSNGYPIGFDRKRFKQIASDITTTSVDADCYDDAFGWDMEEVALSEIEGVEYEARSRDRAAIRNKRCPGLTSAPWDLPDDAEPLRDAIFEWEQWRLSGRKNGRALENARAAYRRYLLAEGLPDLATRIAFADKRHQEFVEKRVQQLAKNGAHKGS